MWDQLGFMICGESMAISGTNVIIIAILLAILHEIKYQTAVMDVHWSEDHEEMTLKAESKEARFKAEQLVELLGGGEILTKPSPLQTGSTCGYWTLVHIEAVCERFGSGLWICSLYSFDSETKPIIDT